MSDGQRTEDQGGCGCGELPELKRVVSGISDSVVSERLAELCQARLVRRSVDEGPPVAVGYALTPAGQALRLALRELTTWAEDNLPE